MNTTWWVGPSGTMVAGTCDLQHIAFEEQTLGTSFDVLSSVGCQRNIVNVHDNQSSHTAVFAPTEECTIDSGRLPSVGPQGIFEFFPPASWNVRKAETSLHDQNRRPHLHSTQSALRRLENKTTPGPREVGLAQKEQDTSNPRRVLTYLKEATN